MNNKTCTHCQSGLTALKVAQSEGQQDVCDILLQYTQEDTNTQQTRRESEKEKERNGQQQETNTELTEVRSIHVQACLEPLISCHCCWHGFQAQQAEVRSIGERMWEQIKRVFLRERVEKELTAQMIREQGTSELIADSTKQRRSFFDRLVSRIRAPRRGRRPVVGTAPAPEL